MAETGSTTKLVVTQQGGTKDAGAKTNNPFSIFTKLELKFPFFNHQDKKQPASEKAAVPAEVESKEIENQKPHIVRFPNTSPTVPPSIEAECHESIGRTHNPVVIWQVYAIGGFFILKWVWARWKERNERAKKPSSDDNQSPTDNGEEESPP